MTKTKKILSLLMALAMLTGMLAVFATTVSAYDEYEGVRCDPIPVGTEKGIYSTFSVGSSSIKSMVRVSGSPPTGMSGYYTSSKVFLSGTPTAPGYYKTSYDVTLTNGKVVRVDFDVMVIKTSVTTRSEVIYVDAMTYQDVYLLHRDVDEGVYTDGTIYSVEKLEGFLPRGLDWSFGEANPPHIYGTPDCAEVRSAKFRIIEYNGNVIEDSVKVVVNPVKTVKSEEKLVLEPGKSYDEYLKDGNTDQYRSVSLFSGSLPDGMDWSYSEVDGPRVKGTPTKAGMYQATFRIINFIGQINEHTVTFVVSGENPFTDVPDGEYYAESVGWAINHGPAVTMGTSDTTFEPNATCTRGQIVTFLWRALGEPAPTIKANPFTDVKTDDYFYSAVLWAVENGVTQGVDATHFGPNQGCTRGQVVTFMWRAFGQPEPTTTTNAFTDVKADQYYYKAVLWAVENGITKGTSDTTFEPNATCTRGQIVTFLCRGMVPEPTEFAINALGDEFLLYVEEVVYITSIDGTAVYGRVVNGSIRPGERVNVYSWNDEGEPFLIGSDVIRLEMNKKELDVGEKGDNIGILLSGNIKDVIKDGAAVVKVGSRLKPYTGKFVGTLYQLPSRRSPITTEDKFQYYNPGSDFTGTILDLNFDYNGKESYIYPGETREGVVIELNRPVVVYQGQQLEVRLSGNTYGTFTVTGKLR